MYLASLMIGCLMVLLQGIVHASDEKRLAYEEIWGEDKVREHLSNIRRPRSVLGIASPAIKALIKSAVEKQTSSEKYRKFLKQGNAGDAIADYYKMKPTIVQMRQVSGIDSTDGFIGDTKLKLQIRSRWPTILIYPKSASPIKIVYIKKVF